MISLERKKRSIRYTLQKTDGTPVELYYSLYTNPLVDKWWRITRMAMERQMPTREIFINTSKKNVDRVMKKINNVLEFINKHYDKTLTIFTDMDEMDNDVLNYLHEEFEVYGDRIQELQGKDQWSYELHDHFLQLNEYIHTIETIMHSDQHKFPNYSLLYDFLPAKTFKTLTEVDKLFISDSIEWGGLYLGYNTLGKDYLSIAPENDWEVVDRDEARIQERFSTETWMNFGPSSDFGAKESFWIWYNTLPKELQVKVPLGDPKKMSLGRYKLGQLQYYGSLVEYESNLDKWRVVPSTLYDNIHKKWNKDIFENMSKIESISLIEDGEIISHYIIE